MYDETAVIIFSAIEAERVFKRGDERFQVIISLYDNPKEEEVISDSTLQVLVLCIGWTAAKWDCNDKIPAEMRKQIVKYQNDFRHKLLKGEVRGTGGRMLYPAKYMHDLDWNCGLENQAASRVKNGMIDTNFLYQTGAASGMVIGPGCYPKPLRFNDFKEAMDQWWNQAGGYVDNRFDDRAREEFAQMMTANNTEVGCSFEKKGRLTAILCLYNHRTTLGQKYYEYAEKTEATTTVPN
ncbi:hypothetical protein Aduo_003052 [Ancylostoma duodenale]